MQRRVGEGAAVRAPKIHVGGDGAVELIADQHAVADQVERLRRHALAVDGHGGQAVLDGAVTRHVHDGRPVARVPNWSKVAKDVPAYAAS